MTDAALEACFLQYLARRIRAEVVWFERGRQSEGESFAKVVKLMQNAWELLPSEGALRAWLTTEVELPDRWLRRVALFGSAQGIGLFDHLHPISSSSGLIVATIRGMRRSPP